MKGNRYSLILVSYTWTSSLLKIFSFLQCKFSACCRISDGYTCIFMLGSSVLFHSSHVYRCTSTILVYPGFTSISLKSMLKFGVVTPLVPVLFA